MSSEIGPLTRDFTLIPRSLKEAQEIGELIAKSGFAPKGYVGKPHDVIIGIQMGLDVGLSPMQALQSIAVINGRPSIYGDAALALVYRSQQLERFDAPEPAGELVDTLTATCTIKRKGQAEIVRTFSVADAKRAKLWGKDGPWTNYPRRMLMWRARAFGIRDTFADVLLGLGIAEESQDIEPVAGEMKVEVVPMPRAIEAPSTPPAPLGPGTATTPPAASPLPAEAEPEKVEPTPVPTPTPEPEKVDAAREAAVARLPKLVEATNENRYLGKQAQLVVHVWAPIDGHPFWGIKFAGGLIAHTHNELVAHALQQFANTDHEVLLAGAMVEHPTAPLQVHAFTLVPAAAPAPAPMPAADALKF